MPKVTIWIRNEDFDIWEAIEDKPKWLHSALNVERLGTKLMNDKVDVDKFLNDGGKPQDFINYLDKKKGTR